MTATPALLTAEDLAAMPDDGTRHELVAHVNLYFKHVTFLQRNS
jgi:hypothetical protein